MKKKILMTTLTLTLALCSIFGLTACGNEQSYNTNQYTITIDYDNGQEDLKITQAYGSAIEYELPTNLTREGYIFNGWDKEIPSTMPAENITITAEWLAVFTLTIDYDNGQEDLKITQAYGSPIEYELPTNLTREGYTFNGWDKEIPSTMPAENITITAEWLAIFTFSGNTITGLTTHGRQFSEIIIPEKIDGVTIKNIGSFAFKFCTSLTSIVIPNSVTSIYFGAFSGCDSLTSIEIPNSVTSIGSEAFLDCDSLTSVVIGESVTNIGNCAFSDCDSLTSIEIPNSVTSIGYDAFTCCDSLTSINYIGTIDQWAQIEFASLFSNPIHYAKKLYINGELVTQANITTATKINASAFACCDSLTSVVIGDSVTSIGHHAFSSCSLTSIEIPDSVTSIGDYAFCGCRSLTSIVIPNSVTSIGDYAFYNCSPLTSIKYRGTESQWQAITKGADWNDDIVNYTITYNYTGE